MIRLHRDRVAIPEIFASEEMQAELARLREYFHLAPTERSQSSYKVQWRLRMRAERALLELSNTKCAYCESSMVTTSGRTVDSFRPKTDALAMDGTVSKDHYWWLMYEWTNLIPSCADCNRLKGRRFPVEGPRAAIGSLGDELKAEGPILIDPFTDDPGEHLVFSEDGLVAGKTERGRVTVEVLGLNRTNLVSQRRHILQALRVALKELISRADFRAEQLGPLVTDDQIYSAARRQFLPAWARELSEEVGPVTTGDLSGAVPEEELRSTQISDEERQHHFQKYHADQARQEAYSVDREEAKPDYFIRTRLIERIEIENFRPIESLDLRVAPDGTPEPTTDGLTYDPTTRQTPWLMVLGENGTGKSSILQAVALCLLGDRLRAQTGLDARRFVRQGSAGGSVHVYFMGSAQPISLTFSKDSSAFQSNEAESKVLLLGYGSTRLLPRAGAEAEPLYDFAQTDNLFNPFVPLGDAAAWLVDLDADTFENVARALKHILQLDENDRLVRMPHGTVEAWTMHAHVPLDEMSDGYQSVLALTCDIMRVMLHRWETMEVAEGIVLLDEIGSHLHPRWRMRIVTSLRQTFPRVQFIASSHDPLCLRGLDNGEVAVMRRDSHGRVVALTKGLPSLRGLRVDQLLTSEFFGLSSTVDPELEGLFREYYQLLALPNPTAEQRTRIDQLRQDLDRYRVLGTSRRERIMLEVIDDFLAKEPDIPDEELRATLKASTKKQLREIWTSVDVTSSAAGRSS